MTPDALASRLQVPVIVIAAAGVALAAYLAANKWLGTDLAYCTAGSGCELVQASRWSSLLGVPIAFWGGLVYVGIFLALVLRPIIKTWRVVHLLAVVGTAISLYLTAMAVFSVGTFCVYCLVSLVLMATILYLSSVAGASRARSWGLWSRGPSVAAGAVLVLGLYFGGVLDSRVGPEDPYLARPATHLEASGVIFYGAYWCPHCQDQKAAFGAASDRLPYVECSPNGPRAPQSAECRRAGIGTYPT
jgi:uncharacterized membrane protein